MLRCLFSHVLCIELRRIVFNAVEIIVEVLPPRLPWHRQYAARPIRKVKNGTPAQEHEPTDNATQSQPPDLQKLP